MFRTKLLFSASSVIAIASIAACGGSQSSTQTTKPLPGAAEVTQDQRFDLEPIELTGMRFEPEALGRPAMPQVEGKRPNLRRARAAVKRKKRKAEDVHVLVSLLWADAQAREAKGDAEGAAAARAEARTALGELGKELGDKTDATTLQMTAIAAVWEGDVEAATTAYRTLLERFPEHEGAPYFKTWLGYLLISSGQSAEAAEVVGDLDLASAPAPAAYVAAWAAHRQGDRERARQAIARAAQTWTDEASWPAVERDMLLILSRDAAPVEEAAAVFSAIAGDNVKKQYVWLFNLSEGYKFAGDFDAAAAALEQNLTKTLGGEEVPGEDVVGFRFRQADYAFRENDAPQAATWAIEAHQALPGCGDKCTGQTAEAVAQRVARLAQFYHTSYSASLDPAHYEAAKKLYEYYVSIPGRPDVEAVQGYLTNLEDTKANANPTNGQHSQEVVNNLVQARREALTACYEARRGHEPELAGAVTLTIDIDTAGQVANAVTDPAAGESGLAAVGACMAQAARTWSFPSRTVKGTTVVQIPVRFAIPQESPGAPAATPAE